MDVQPHPMTGPMYKPFPQSLPGKKSATMFVNAIGVYSRAYSMDPPFLRFKDSFPYPQLLGIGGANDKSARYIRFVSAIICAKINDHQVPSFDSSVTCNSVRKC